MEIEKTPPKMAKKLWNLVRIVFYMMRKGISKSKLSHDLNFLIKQGKTASKTVGNLMIQHHHHHYYSALTCRADDVLSSFVSPREYEFSCSNSPAYPYHQYSRRKNQHHHHYSALSCRSDDVLSSFVSPREYEFSCSNSPAYPHHHSRRKNQHHRPTYDHRFHHQGEEIDVLQKVFDILNLRDHTGEAYPVMGLPGLGHSPLVRQLRVTDSPFAVNDHTEENHQVDKDAEKFIKRFYKDLRNQRRIAALMESPSSYHM